MNRAVFDKVCAMAGMKPQADSPTWAWPDGTYAFMEVDFARVRHSDGRVSPELHSLGTMHEYLQDARLDQIDSTMSDNTEHEFDSIDVDFIEWSDDNGRYGIGRRHGDGVALTFHAGDLTTGLDRCITHVLSNEQAASLASALTSMARRDRA